MTELRILPLISSATEIVHALGLGGFQVGRSHECDYPSEVLRLPVCTRPAIPVSGSSAEIDRLVREHAAAAASIYEVDTALIRELRPTHIITQTQCKVCAVSLDDVERAFRGDLGVEAKIVAVEPYALEDLFGDIYQIGNACGLSDLAEQLIAALRGRITSICMCARTAATRPSVAAVEWLEPLMAGGNWVPELIEAAGGQDLFRMAGQHSPCMTWQDLVQANPDIIVALPCGFDLARTRSEMHWLSDRREWRDLQAVQNRRVFICDGNQFMNRPGPRLVESLQAFAEMLHPELFAPALQGIAWERFC